MKHILMGLLAVLLCVHSTMAKTLEEKRNTLNGIAIGPDDHLVVVGGFQEQTGVIVDSPDGEQWYAQPANPDHDEQGLWGVCHGAGKYVAVGCAGTVVSSQDGSAWKEEASIPGEHWLMDVIYAGGKFVAGGVTGLHTSADGITWTTAPKGIGNIYGISHGAGLYVAVGYQGRVFTSPDALTWTRRETGSGFMLRSVVYGNGMFIAVGGEGQHGMLISHDGITWFNSSSGSKAQLMDIVFADGKFHVVGGAMDPVSRECTAGTIEVSANGRDWVTSFVAGPKRLDALALRKGTWFVIGDEGFIGQIGKAGQSLHLKTEMSGDRLALALTAESETASATEIVGAIPSLTTSDTPGGLVLKWPSVPGRTYRVRRSSDLKSWEDAGVSYEGTGEPLTHQELFKPGIDIMYFRLEIY